MTRAGVQGSRGPLGVTADHNLGDLHGFYLHVLSLENLAAVQVKTIKT